MTDLVGGGARALFVLLLERDGQVRLARRHALADLEPEVFQVRALATHRTTPGAPALVASLLVGRTLPLDEAYLERALTSEGALVAP